MRTPPPPPANPVRHPPLPRRLRLKLERIYKDIGKPRREKRWGDAWPLIDSVEGWMMPGQERWLYDAAHSLPDPANIVEIGSFKGRSTCALGFGCEGTRKRIYAIDPFDGGGWDLNERDFFAQFKENVERCGVSHRIEPIKGLSTDVARGWTRPIDLLFIDGSHDYEAVKADFEGFFPHVVPGGIVALHDVSEDWPGVLRFWKETARQQLIEAGSCQSLAYGRKPS